MPFGLILEKIARRPFPFAELSTEKALCPFGIPYFFSFKVCLYGIIFTTLFSKYQEFKI